MLPAAKVRGLRVIATLCSLAECMGLRHERSCVRQNSRFLTPRYRRMRYHCLVATYYVENFGCRATQADGAALARQFDARGLARASTAAQADLLILNSCTVTASADQDARAAIRRARRQNPEA